MHPAWAAHLPPGVTPASLGLLFGRSVAAVAAAAWRQSPHRPVLMDTDGTWLTGEQLETGSSDVARRLGAAGLSPGDRVILCAGTSAAWLIAYLGVLRAGPVAFAAKRLAPYKVPKAVEFVDALPRNSLGKVLRHQI